MKNFSKGLNLLAAVCALAVGVSAQEQGMELSGFRVPEYDNQGNMTAQLFGRHAEVRAAGEVKIDQLRLEFYQSGERFVTVESPFCLYDSQKREARSDAVVSAVADKIEVTGRGFEWIPAQHSIRVFNDVHVVLENTGGFKDALLSGGLTSPEAVSSNAAVSGPVTGGVVTVTSGELFLDYTEKIVQFDKNVVVLNSDGTEMRCEKLKIPLNEGRRAGLIKLPGMPEAVTE